MGPRSPRRSGRHRTTATGSEAGALDVLERSPDSDDDFTIDQEYATENILDLGAQVESGDELESAEDETPKDGRRKDVSAVQEEPHSRGLPKPAAQNSKYQQMTSVFGPGRHDLLSMVHTRDNWTGPRDVTLPSKATLRQALNAPAYGSGATYGASHDLISRESSSGWDWYYDDSNDQSFGKRQRIKPIQPDIARNYLPMEQHTKHTVLIGPYGDQKTYKLGQGESFNFGDAWAGPKTRPEKKQGRPKKSEDRTGGKAATGDSSGKTASSQQSPREGWILNVGEKVQALSWAPNCSGTQFLAVAVSVSGGQQGETSTQKSETTPAFTPSPPHPAAIQIWAFESCEDGELGQLDLAVQPRLRLVLCTDAGDVKSLSWCPMPRERRPEDGSEEALNVGLIAGIWGDGTVKVLDVTVEKKVADTELVRVDAASFEAKPATTLCTCVNWLSPSDIAVGCANGFVGIWNISASNGGERGDYPAPYIYRPIHHTYILHIASAYPSHPHIIATADVDGQGQLTSLLDPLADSAESPRLRVASADLVYSPCLQCFVSSSESGTVRILPLRRFFSGVGTFNLDKAMVPIATCSPFHPCILAGTAAGTAVSSNVFRKAISTKERLWQQTWFRHEWVAGREQSDAINNTGSRLPGCPGVSRFHDGFKAEVATAVSNSPLPASILEDGTGITALSWNPNRRCAGWACAGLGCGLIRVEDLSH